jgi:hypothetical protein
LISRGPDVAQYVLTGLKREARGPKAGRRHTGELTDLIAEAWRAAPPFACAAEIRAALAGARAEIATLRNGGGERPASLLRAAHVYIKHGIPVVPFAAMADGSRRPLQKWPGGVYHASVQSDTVEMWWQASPTALIAVPLGARTGLCAVEVGAPQAYGQDGDTALARLQSDGDWQTWTHGAPDGGKVLLFDHDAELPNVPQFGDWQALKFSTDGEALIMPPSCHGGASYSVIDATPVIALPANLRAAIVAGAAALPVPATGAVAEAAAQKLALEDFVAYLPEHKYIHRATRAIWVPSGVNGLVAWPTKIVDGKTVRVPPNREIDDRSPIHCLSWLPGEGEVISDTVINHGGRVPAPHCNTYNLYLPPTVVPAAGDVQPWLEHIAKLYPDDHQHIVQYCAFMVQHPGVKINHALVIGGATRIGKDTIFVPVKQAVGLHNFREIRPTAIIETYTDYLECVFLTINEAKDQGDYDRYALDDALKTVTAAPPDIHRIHAKYGVHHNIPNVCKVAITTNHKIDSLYVAPDTSRYYITWCTLVEGDFASGYWPKLYNWYEAENGCAIVAHYLQNLNVSKFNPKASPPKTEAFWAMAQAHISTESTDLDDLLDLMGRPETVTLEQVVTKALSTSGFEATATWFADRKNRRVMSIKFDDSGYRPCKNPTSKQGLWVIKGRKQIIYVLNSLNDGQALKAAEALYKRENDVKPHPITQGSTVNAAATPASKPSHTRPSGNGAGGGEVPF